MSASATATITCQIAGGTGPIPWTPPPAATAPILISRLPCAHWMSLMEQEGIQVVFDTNFCAPIMEGKTCKGVIVENKSGRTAYLAKAFVDASGDLDLMFRAGAPTETQRSIVSHWAHEIDLDTMKKAWRPGRPCRHCRCAGWGFAPMPITARRRSPCTMAPPVRASTDISAPAASWRWTT